MCYTTPIFTVIENNSIQITVQKARQSLAKAVFVSCTVLANSRTSVFSHQIALVDDATLHFQEDQLPSIQLSDHVHLSIDKSTRLISKADLLDGIFYPVYADDKVSLQCLDSQFVTINGKERYNDSQALHFIDFPESIEVKGKSIMAAHVPHHFSSKLDFMNSDFRSVSAFRETKHNDPSFKTDIVHLLHSATEIHYSFAAMAVCLLMASFVEMLFGPMLHKKTHFE